MESRKPKKRQGFKAPQDSAIVVVRCEDDVVLIKLPKKGDLPEIWKFPEGKIPKTITPEQAAVQRLRERTGLEVDPRSLILLSRTMRTAHWMPHQVYFFGVFVPNLDGLKNHGRGNEATGVFSLEAIGSIANFHRYHRSLIEGLAKKSVY